jgi:CheY-like chemotaxis protein
MDIQLPVMDGYEATRRIKADPSLSSIPIIAVTSYALSGDEEKARAAGCDDFVPKPYSPRQLPRKNYGVFAIGGERLTAEAAEAADEDGGRSCGNGSAPTYLYHGRWRAEPWCRSLSPDSVAHKSPEPGITRTLQKNWTVHVSSSASVSLSRGKGSPSVTPAQPAETPGITDP